MSMTGERHGSRTDTRVVDSDPRPRMSPSPMRVVTPVGRRRRQALATLGVALIATGGLATMWLVGQAGDRVAVLRVARAVAFGQAIADADLSVVDVAVDPAVATVGESERDAVVGKIAAVALLPGTLLAPAALSENAAMAPGDVLVTLAVPLARIPASGLRTGQLILVVNTPPTDADAPTESPVTLAATVIRVADASEDLSSSGAVVVDVSAKSADGPMLAAWSATGRIAIVILH